jgi:hypothetical protein
MKAHQEFHKEGRLMRLSFVISPDTLKEVERMMKLDERILRFMTIKERNTSFMSLGGYKPDDLAASVQKLVSARLKDGTPPRDYLDFSNDPSSDSVGFGTTPPS